MDDKSGVKAKAKVEISFFSFWLIGFLFFWSQSGWYRVDCALGIHKACDLIQAEYNKKAQP